MIFCDAYRKSDNEFVRHNSKLICQRFFRFSARTSEQAQFFPSKSNEDFEAHIPRYLFGLFLTRYCT